MGERNAAKRQLGTKMSDLGVPWPCMAVRCAPHPAPHFCCPECIKKGGCSVANTLWLLQFDHFYPYLLVHLARVLGP